jgi:hypothetical protein
MFGESRDGFAGGGDGIHRIAFEFEAGDHRHPDRVVIFND